MIHRGILLIGLLTLSACSYNSIIPQDFAGLVDQNVTFSEIKEPSPSYQGKVIVLGGEVLNATRLKEQTRLTILQLPTSENYVPTMDRMQSQGRFLAFQSDFLDPAIVPAGTKVTIVGEVSGIQTELLDEMEYSYPTVTIKYLKVWPETIEDPYRYAGNGYPYYQYSYYPSYWYPGQFVRFGAFRYGYWW